VLAPPGASGTLAADKVFAPDFLLFGLTNKGISFIITNMRILWRTTVPGPPRDTTLVRDIGLVCLADGIVGVSFGAASVAGGLPWWVPVALSVLVFAGGSQIAAVGVVLAGGSPLAAVAAGTVLNTRLLPYGLAVADLVRPAGLDGDSRADRARGRRATGRRARGRWARLARQLVGTHLITDESVAFALRQPDPARRRAAFWTCGVGLFAVWNVAVLLGVLAGSMIKDTNAFGLDATFPAVLLALALPALNSRSIRVAAGTGAVLAVALTPVLPAGLPLLAALGGLGARWNGWRNWPGRRADSPPTASDPGSRPAVSRPDDAAVTSRTDGAAMISGEVPAGDPR
jgi:predicted branched-subunit amino acid permease